MTLHRRTVPARLTTLSAVALALSLTGASAAEVAAELQQALSEQTHDTQVWWGGSCRCHPATGPGTAAR